MKPKVSLSTFWKTIILSLLLLMNIALAYHLLLSEKSFFAWKEAQETHKDLELKLAEIDAQKTEISNQIYMLQNDKNAIERYIRQRLNYVRDGEILYLFEKQEDNDSPWLEEDSAKIISSQTIQP